MISTFYLYIAHIYILVELYFIFYSFFLFFFNDPPTTEIYTLSLHDALPILLFTTASLLAAVPPIVTCAFARKLVPVMVDRKSTRLNSSHSQISYAVFCLKKKKK